MPPTNTTKSNAKEELYKMHELYIKASYWIRDMSAPRAPARLRYNNPGMRAAGGGPSK
mgnify:CR=1 FL=1|jgi:hypothetical protein|tara:strand:- start:3311 stop:3484 length:174 start_codon:yes stop_codon:yes gene_type:complete